MEDYKNSINNRFLARIIIEAETPLSVKSGEKSVVSDAVVITDVNGLPYIPGSSIAGVLRHAWKDLKGEDEEKNLFGFQKGEDGVGSRIIFSEARILNSEGKVMDGMLYPEKISKDDLLKHYVSLPIRQHVRIGHHGVAEEHGKFDEQVVFAGTRFCFEIEMLGNDKEVNTFSELLEILNYSSFRLGSGTRCGFGKIKVVSIQQASMSVNDERYLDKSSNLEESKNWKCWKTTTERNKEKDVSEGWRTYTMTLIPDDFFLFGSGFGDENADMTPVTELKVAWKENLAEIKEHAYLLPASSIKGAIAHRVAYHYNRLIGIFADDFINGGKNKEGKTISDYVGANNTAVRLLFGSEGKGDTKKIRGNVLFSDMYIESADAKDKILNHVAIDRFTGGAIDGALFAEKTVYGKGTHLKLELQVNETGVRKMAENDTVYTNIMSALGATLDNLCNGMLPLGGGVNRGNGVFHGKLINEERKEA